MMMTLSIFELKVLIITYDLVRSRNSGPDPEVLARLGAFEKRIWACDNRIEEVFQSKPYFAIS